MLKWLNGDGKTIPYLGNQSPQAKEVFPLDDAEIMNEDF